MKLVKTFRKTIQLFFAGCLTVVVFACGNGATGDTIAGDPPVENTPNGLMPNTLVFKLGGVNMSWNIVREKAAFRIDKVGDANTNHIFGVAENPVARLYNNNADGIDMEINGGGGIQWGANCNGANFDFVVNPLTPTEITGTIAGTLRNCALAEGSPNSTIAVTEGRFRVDR
jgi:hypothetical protein